MPRPEPVTTATFPSSLPMCPPFPASACSDPDNAPSAALDLAELDHAGRAVPDSVLAVCERARVDEVASLLFQRQRPTGDVDRTTFVSCRLKMGMPCKRDPGGRLMAVGLMPLEHEGDRIDLSPA